MNRKQIQILVRAALEPGNARLLNWSSDHSAMKISIMPALHFMLQLKRDVQNYASILHLTLVITETCQSQLICCVKIIIIGIPCHAHKRQFWYLSEMFFFFYNFFFDIFLLHKLSVLVNHSPQSSCKLVLNQELTCLSALVKIMYLFC